MRFEAFVIINVIVHESYHYIFVIVNGKKSKIGVSVVPHKKDPWTVVIQKDQKRYCLQCQMEHFVWQQWPNVEPIQ